MESINSYRDSEILHRQDRELHEWTGPDGQKHSFGGPDPRSDDEIWRAEILFWRRSQPTLGNAASLIQQSVELALKGRIAAISPFLLILRPEGRDLPKGIKGGDIPFSSFRSVDAADLLRLHNTVVTPELRLDDKFAGYWDDLRRRRNVIMHSARASGTTSRLLTSPELAKDIIRVTLQLHPGKSWYERMVEHGEADKIAAAHDISPEVNRGAALLTLAHMVDVLRPAFVREYLGIDERRRLYECPACLGAVERNIFDDDPFPRYARLVAQPDGSAYVSCPICRMESPVIRGKCTECKGTVLCVEPHQNVHRLMCLSRGEDLGDPPSGTPRAFPSGMAED